MNKHTITLGIVISIIVIMIILYRNKQALQRIELRVNTIDGKGQHPAILLAAQTIEMCVNIGSINGNGNAIGNNNLIENFN